MQSMLTCDTMDTAACVQQSLDLVAVGCQIVRIHRAVCEGRGNLQNIVAELRRRGWPGTDRRGHSFQTRSSAGGGEMG